MPTLFKIISQNKKTLVLIIGLSLFLSLVPSNFAQAVGWGDLVEGITNVGTYIITIPVRIVGFSWGIILSLLGLIVGFLFFIAAGIMTWAVDVCLTVPITHGGIVDIGLTFTRDFANMCFILILVFIGLATILKIKDYEAKKILPLLIIVALLINFSQVLVGFIVDITNIVTNFFLTQMGDFSFEHFKDILELAWGPLQTSLELFAEFEHGFIEVIGTVIGLTLYGFALIAFYGFATIVYLFVVILLISRIIALWILMILAPIVFLFYILPATRKSWDEWWKQLIQWSIIGIPIGFFLYLSTWIMKNQPVINTQFDKGNLALAIIDPEISELEVLTESFANLLSNMLAPAIALLILYIGVKYSKKHAPEEALKIIAGVEKGFKIIATTAVVAATMGAGAAGAAGLMGKAAMGAKKLEGFVGKAKLGKIPIGKALKWGVKPTSWMTRGLEITAGGALEKYAAKARKIDAPATMKPYEGDISAQENAIDKTIKDEHKLQKYQYMAKEGTLQKTSDKRQEMAAALVEKFAGNTHFRKEAGDIINVIPDKINAKTKIKFEPTLQLQGDMEKEIKEEAKKLSQEIEMKPVIDEEARKLVNKGLFKTEVDAQELAAENVAAKKIRITELKQGDIKDMSKSSVESTVAARAFRDMTPAHIQAVVNNFKPKTSSKVLDETFNRMFKDIKTGDYYSDEKNREILEKYLTPASNKQEDVQIAARHTRMLRWSQTTPAGREMNIIWKKYMKDPNDQPTTNLDALDRRIRIKEELVKEPILFAFNNYINKANEDLREIKHRRREGRGTARLERNFEANAIRVDVIWKQIEKTRQLWEKWEEVENLRQPKKRKH